MGKIIQSLPAIINDNKKTLLLIIVAVSLIIFAIPRIHYNLFWGDECYSIISAQSFDNLLKYAYTDGANPILYYLILYICVSVFGGTPETYHLVSFIPWIIILILSITWIRKKFGSFVSLIFMILATLLETSFYYLVEVRSYELDILFMLLGFLFLLEILQKHEKKHYYCFIIVSLLGAYSHYYCILASIFLYFILLVDSWFINKQYKKMFAFTVVATIIGYSPWLILKMSTIAKSSTTMWMKTVPSIKECIESFFLSSFSQMLFLAMIICSAIIIFNNIKKSKNDNQPPSPETLWIIAGVCAVIGSILVSVLFSTLISPVLVTRYLFPVSVIAWLLLSYSAVHCCNDIKVKNVIIIAIVGLVLITGIPHCQVVLFNEKNSEAFTERTLERLDFIEEGDYILSDVDHFDWTILDYYLPGIEHTTKPINPYELPEIDKERQNFLFIYETMDEKIEGQLSLQGLGYETIMEDAHIQGLNFKVYEITVL